MKGWCYSLLLFGACGGDGRGETVPSPPVVAAVPEHYELGTLPPLAVPPVGIEIGYGKLLGPETAIHDVLQDVYFVSNIVGDANATDDNGYISMVSPMGELIDQYFIDGRRPDITLHAPRGMVVGGDTLYVADEGAIRLFDRMTGEPKGSWNVPDSHFLNDLAIDSQGRVLATETGIEILPSGPVKRGAYRIYAFDAKGTPTVLAEGDELHGPNGIVAGERGIFVVEFMGSENGVFELQEGGRKQVLGTLPYGQLDGLVLLPDGSMLVSSWQANGIYRFVPGMPAIEVLQHLTTPAGIAYDAIRGRVLVPELLGNTLHIEPWAPPAAQLVPMTERWDPYP